jgi:hypothetical protein
LNEFARRACVGVPPQARFFINGALGSFGLFTLPAGDYLSRYFRYLLTRTRDRSPAKKSPGEMPGDLHLQKTL